MAFRNRIPLWKYHYVICGKPSKRSAKPFRNSKLLKLTSMNAPGIYSFDSKFEEYIFTTTSRVHFIKLMLKLVTTLDQIIWSILLQNVTLLQTVKNWSVTCPDKIFDILNHQIDPDSSPDNFGYKNFLLGSKMSVWALFHWFDSSIHN